MSATYGIIVSEPGFDVFTAADKNISLKTNFTLLKVYSQAQIAVNSSQVSVTHSLGYLPQYLAFVKDNLGNTYLSVGLFHGVSAPVAVAHITTTQLTIYQTYSPGQTAFYYIFYEPIDTGTAPSNVSTNHYGIMVTKDGYDVSNANILQQTFNSEKNSLKIITDATINFSSNTTQQIAHGLSFTPGFIAFETDGDGKWYHWSNNCHSDATYLYIISTTGTSVHYYILADPGENV